MVDKIYNEFKKVEVSAGNKKFVFEFDGDAYCEFEKRTSKSIFQVYEDIMSGEAIMQDDARVLVACGLKKNLSAQEVSEIELSMYKNTNILFELQNAAKLAFLISLMPMEIVEKKYSELKKNPFYFLWLKIKIWLKSLKSILNWN